MSDVIEPIGYLCRHRSSVSEALRIAPGESTDYLWQYTHGTKDIAAWEASDHLEVQRVYGAATIERLTAENEALRAYAERVRADIATLHMAQALNNQNLPSAWHDAVDAALEAIDAARKEKP